MAKYYEFPAPVTVQQAGRIYLSKLEISLATPMSGDVLLVEVTYLVTDENGSPVQTLRRTVSRATFNAFLMGLSTMPGADPEEKLLNATPALIGLVPPGGVLKSDLPPPDPSAPPV